ncbi:MAG: TVP38/TMEM64 family protein [Thermoleophilia bacterium]
MDTLSRTTSMGSTPAPLGHRESVGGVADRSPEERVTSREVVGTSRRPTTGAADLGRGRERRLVLLAMLMVALAATCVASVRAVLALVLTADAGALERLLAPLGALAPLALVGLNVVQGVLAPIPGTALVFVSGGMFGPWMGSLVNWVGGIAAATTCFAIARVLGRARVAQWAETTGCAGRMAGTIEHLGRSPSAGMVVALARAVPGSPFDVVSYGAGLSSIRFWPFLWGTAVGSAPHAIAYAVLGASLKVPIWMGVLATLALGAAFGLVVTVSRLLKGRLTGERTGPDLTVPQAPSLAGLEPALTASAVRTAATA